MAASGLVVAAVLAVSVAGCAGTSTPTSPAGIPRARVPRLDPCPVVPAARPAAHNPPPAAALSCFDSQGTVHLTGLRGTPTLVNVWASWCVPCREEMPRLQAAYRHANGAVRFLGIDTSDDHESAQDFLAAVGVTYPQAIDITNRLPREMGAPGIPVTVVIDGQGSVVYYHAGAMTPTSLRDALDAIAHSGGRTPRRSSP